MNDFQRDSWAALVLSVALVVSFLLCVASDLKFGAILTEAGIELPATGRILTLGYSWLLGHGLHGAAVIAVPIWFLGRAKAKAAPVNHKRQ